MNFLQHVSIRQSKFIIAGLVVLCAGVIYLILFSLPLRTCLDLNNRLALTKDKLLIMEEALYRRDQVEALCKKYEERILATGTDAEELGFLLKELESLTRTRNVRVKRIRPLPSQWIGSYRRFLVSLEVEGRVHNMFELLHAINTSPKILIVESLTIQALRTAPNLISANILISRTSAGSKLQQQYQ
ncbi:MAG: type 4a pilus biogenesis protein PilO [candidate division Zixibacteria bacterium]|nr:type 4a pilus biogenesis protein PilO [Phycisphaerae bacterium]NIR64396.1 type 4a pilus biogenesis protein PilO [candidate division Zixibacteria bacterium]NIP53587.1 type 4a pilus biogenesis protein PilO [Phycisphaerae bacterium]NIS52545.1 type 4a pilus biogenesis protein PilO [Phycisphaerae bacterium]NIU14402.1 type 4a pilus biogenesis protein PilO [candidate division Zixibacteria bacterium]